MRGRAPGNSRSSATTAANADHAGAGRGRATVGERPSGLLAAEHDRQQQLTGTSPGQVGRRRTERIRPTETATVAASHDTTRHTKVLIYVARARHDPPDSACLHPDA